MKSAVRILVGLISGLAVGLIIAGTHNAAALAIANVIEPVGKVWVGLLTMTVIPLLVSLLITSIAGAGDPRRLGRIAGKALVAFVLLYALVAVITTLIVPVLFASSLLSVDAMPSLRDATAVATEGAAQAPPLVERIVGLIPTNPFAAAARGEILPLVIFAILFGLALVHIQGEIREVVVRFFQGVAEAMLVIVRWMLVLAPLGIFAVVMPLAARRGLAIAGALATYVTLIAVLCAAFALVFYALAKLVGRVPLRQFARASAPAQSVALGTQSSLAALPTMIEAAESRLGIPHRVSGVVLPLAVSVFRVSTPIWLIVASFFVAELYGITLDAGQVATLCVMSVLVSVGGIGLPSGASYFGPITAVFLALDLPAEALPLLFAVDTIPDMAETATNVTADMAVATVVNASAPANDLRFEK